MPLEVGDIVLVSWRGLCFGQRIILTHTYRVSVAPDPESTVWQNLDSIIDAVDVGGAADITTNYLALLPAAYGLNEIRAQRVYPIRSAYFSKAKAEEGGHAGAATVANDAAAVTLRTDYAGRNQIATKHIGPVPDAASASGLIVTAYKTLLTAFATDLLLTPAFGTTGSLIPIIYHRATNGHSDVVSYRLGDQSRTQRRRTVGVGE